MQDSELNTMSKDQLVELQAKIERELVRRDQDRRAKARSEVERIASEAGLSVGELLGRSAKKSSSRPKSPPKYRHPENPSLTWVGRGKQPDWFKDVIENGMSKEDLLIKK